MKRRWMGLLCCVVLSSMFLYAQNTDEGYQMARVVAFNQMPSSAQHPEDADRYKISLRLGDITYNCKARGSAATFNDWTINKQYPAKVQDKKTMLVKNTDGQILEMEITGKRK